MKPHTYYCCIKHKLFKKIAAIEYPPAIRSESDPWHKKRKEAFTRLFKDLEEEAKNGCAPDNIAFEGYWTDKDRRSGPSYLRGLSNSQKFIQEGPRVQLWNNLIDKTIDGKPFVGFVDAFLAVTYKHFKSEHEHKTFSFGLGQICSEMVWTNARRRLVRLGQAQEMPLQ